MNINEAAKLVALAQSGDATAMNQLLEQSQDIVHYTCLKFLKNEDE